MYYTVLVAHVVSHLFETNLNLRQNGYPLLSGSERKTRASSPCFFVVVVVLSLLFKNLLSVCLALAIIMSCKDLKGLKWPLYAQ